MNRITTVTLALVAGLIGGWLTRYLAPSPVFAQTRPVTREMRAQSFTLVDGMDNAIGTFLVEPAPRVGLPRDGVQSMQIVLRDSAGREIWSAGGTGIRQLSQNVR